MKIFANHDGVCNWSGAVVELQNKEWARLSERYLPIVSQDSIWRYSRTSKSGDAEQGWKLHISATILSANSVFAAVAPYLTKCGTLFKAACSLKELEKLNSGLHYGYSQVGKFITVYPRTAKEAVLLGRKLRFLTRHAAAPAVPFDQRFGTEGCIYYRYGSFKRLEIENQNGIRLPALRDPEGNLIPDQRYSESSPEWVSDPFANEETGTEPVDSPLKSTFPAFEALTQRGKGGVYKALDLSVSPPRLCILKEGRRHGETTWDDRDGKWLVRREKEVLSSLRASGIEVPAIYSSFEFNDNHYLVIEYIEGESLQDVLFRMRRRLSVTCALQYAIQLADLLGRIHDAGWAWRDCKPANLIVANDGRLRPVDFEGSSQVHQTEGRPWSTPAFMPQDRSSGKQDDLYALGAVIYFLFTGRLADRTSFIPLAKLRRKLPLAVCEVVEGLLSREPGLRPDAGSVRRRLELCGRLGQGKVIAPDEVQEPGI